MKNRAVIFIKPHAMTEESIRFTEKFLREHGVELTDSGELSAEKIDQDGIVDRHYFAIAKTAVQLTPEKYVLSEDAKEKFQAAFGETWDEALSKNKVYNSRELMAKLGIKSGKELQDLWLAGKQTKLGPGLYAGFLEEHDVYVINGFYPAMREKFTAAGEKIRWYAAEFDPDTVSWKKFRGEVIGATDPGKAADCSLRKVMLEQYEKLGQSVRPSMSNNGIHASAGPIEGLRERMVWLGADPFSQELAGVLMEKGVRKDVLETWLENGEAEVNGQKGPVFDITEDMDARSVVEAIKV